MLSKSQISSLKSLQHKKERMEQGLFLVEGYKSVVEFINSAYQTEAIFHTASFEPKVLKLSQKINLYNISVTDLEKISSLKTPQEVIALVKLPSSSLPSRDDLKGKFSLVLDGVQDPGNLGTIIRTADWFGIQHIICSEDTADAYNPKVVQASMGSLPRVSVSYTNILQFLVQVKVPVFGALLNGKSIYEVNFGREGLIILGSEGKGMHNDTERLVTQAVTIPRTGKAESLNVAIAASLICSEVCRKMA